MTSIKNIFVVKFISAFIFYATAHSVVQHKLDLLSKQPGHTIPNVDEPYEPKGRTTFIEFLNTTVYDTYLDEGNSTGEPLRVLILGHDGFGVSDRFRQIADKIAAGKPGTGTFRVVMPDFFRNSTPGNWEDGADRDIRNTLNYYQRDNGSDIITSFGIFGFCWGAMISVKAGQEFNAINGIGLIHPYGVVTEDAYTLMSPALLLPGSDDPDMDPFEEIIINQAGIDSVFHRRFTDVTHGFAGAGGNWSDPLVNARVDQVISWTIDFFNKHL